MILRVDWLLQGLTALAPVLQHRGLFLIAKQELFAKYAPLTGHISTGLGLLQCHF